jgi:hypothetical protein
MPFSRLDARDRANLAVPRPGPSFDPHHQQDQHDRADPDED